MDRPPRMAWQALKSCNNACMLRERALMSPTSVLLFPFHFQRAIPVAQIRPYRTTTPHHDYPKEGVFQPDSPPRRTPETTRYFPQPSNDPGTQFHDAQDAYPPPPPSRFRVLLRYTRYGLIALLSLGSLALGFTVATDVSLRLVPYPLDPSSPEDTEQLSSLTEELDALPLVQQLRSEAHISQATNEVVKTWEEWPAYNHLNKHESHVRRNDHLSTGPLRGSRGLAAQHIFWSAEQNTVMCFINFGEALCGIPGTVHGGAIATVMDEGMARLGMLSLARNEKKNALLEDGQATVKGTDLPEASTQPGESLEPRKMRPMVTAWLNVAYHDKCFPGQWYVLISQLDTFTRAAHESTNRKCFVAGVMVCVGKDGPLMQDLFRVDDGNEQDEWQAARAMKGSRTSAGSWFRRWRGGSGQDDHPVGSVHGHVQAQGLFVIPKSGPAQSIERDF